MDQTIHIPKEIQSHRFPEFDSLRGLAAGSVVLHHILAIWEGSNAQWWIRTLPTGILVSGTSAVTLFFVLSGFVLTLPYKRPKHPGYATYLIKRICRIYLPYVATLFIALSVLSLVREPVYTGNSWLDGNWNRNVDWGLVLKHLSGVGNFDTHVYVNPFWTLVLEMRVSLFMPLIAVLALRVRFSVGMTIAVFGNLGFWYLTKISKHGMLPQTLQIGCIFLLGAVLAANFEKIASRWRTLPKGVRGFALSLSLYVYTWFSFRNFWFPPATSLIVALASLCFLLEASQSRRIRRILHLGVILRLGEISYSLYLVHMIVLLALVHLFWGKISMLVLVPVILLGSYGTAEIFHHVVELPTIMLGRFLEKRLSGMRGVASRSYSTKSVPPPYQSDKMDTI
ncbi:acyltransferase family protein [Terriglobus albidus]|uniref:acyltransferase family protein n=1 Tax=Terriglobus albidus TaxID=1592106 RepID=UPI0021E0518C|nr:acyltransferase [Terriglobus albidus]